MISVTGFVCGSAPIRAITISGRVWPPALTPRIWLVWLTAIRMPDAVMNPAMTGWDRKLARKPSLSTPISTRIAPDRNASVSAATP